MSTVAAAIAQGRRRILALDAQMTADLLRNYDLAWRAVERDLRILELRIDAAQAAGETVNPAWLRRQAWWRQTQASIETQMQRFTLDAAQTVTRTQVGAVRIAQGVGLDYRAAIRTPFEGRVNVNAFERWVSAQQPGSPIRQVIDRYGDRVSESIQRNMSEGLGSGKGVRQITRQIVAEVGADASQARLQALTRTETMRAYRGAQRDDLSALAQSISGKHEWEWLSTKSVRTCLACLSRDGRVQKEPWDQMHVNCFPAGTVVSTAGIEVVYRSWYDGPLIEITTSRGHNLRGTPNHPVLTNRGWVALHMLNKRDNVVCGSLTEGVGSQNPDVDDIPAEISDVFDSLCDIFPLHRVPARHNQFHGDGGHDGYVDVVATDGVLPDGSVATIGQPLSQETFSLANDPLLALASDRSLVDGFGSVSLPSTRVMGSRRGIESLIGSHLGHTCNHALGTITGDDSGTYKPSANPTSGNSKTVGESELGFSRLIETDQIVKIDIGSFSGHVYNFQTETSRYVANTIVPPIADVSGIIVHNCRCISSPVSKGSTLQYQTGEDWFATQSPERQQRMLPSRAAWDAYRDGRVALGDFVGTRSSGTWGSSVYQRSGRDVLAQSRPQGRPTLSANALAPTPPPPKAIGQAMSDDELREWAFNAGSDRVTTSDAVEEWANYKEEGYQSINGLLRDGRALDDDLWPMLEDFDRYQIPNDATTYRFVRFTDETPIELAEEFVPDGMVVDLGFGSATTNREFLEEFAYQGESEYGIVMTIRAPKNTRLVSLNEADDHLQEWEVVYPPGTRYHVIETEGLVEDGRMTVDAVALPPGTGEVPLGVNPIRFGEDAWADWSTDYYTQNGNRP